MTIQHYVTGVLFWLSLSVAHATTLILDNNQDSVALGLHTEFFVDQTNALSVDKVIQLGNFQPSRHEALNFGFTQSRIWLRFAIENPSSDNMERILNIRYWLLDEIDLYHSDATGRYLVERLGRMHPEKFSTQPGRFYSFALSLPANSVRIFYLSVKSDDSIALPVMLSTARNFQQYMFKDSIGLTLYAGLIISNIFFALFMLNSFKERDLVYYVTFLVLHHLVAIMLMEGVPSAIFDIQDITVTRKLLPLAINLSILCTVLFMRNFLRLQQLQPHLFDTTHILVGMLTISALQSLVLPHFYAMAITTLLCMAAGGGIGYICIQRARQGHREAILFLAAWSTGIAGAMLYGLKVWNLLPVNMFTSYSWHVGTALETVLFSYTIADRVSSERKQRLLAQTQLTQQERTLRITQEKLLNSETAAKEELEIRVRERTRDISRILSELEHENKALAELSVNDSLTRVRNRRFFNDIFPQLWHEALEQQHWLSVIMLDIDHFKTVNDSHGHLAGDQCLVAIANLLKQSVSRPGDVICRYGGEEFIIVLPNTTTGEAHHVAERIRKKICNATFVFDAVSLKLTASLGICGMIPEPGLDSLKLVAACDAALYVSKSSGRNQVTTGEKPRAPENVTQLSRKA